MCIKFAVCGLSGFGDFATFCAKDHRLSIGKLAVFESSNISETGEVTPTKIGVHVCYINTYLHEFFEPISNN